MDINKLRETVDSKDQEVNELKSSLEEARKIIAAQEKEWSTKISEDTETIEKLKQTCQMLKMEKNSLLNMRISLKHALDNKAKAKLQLEQEKRAKETAESQLSIVPQLEPNTQQMYNCTRATCPTYQTPSSYKLTHVREQLSLRNVEVEALERRIRMLQEAEKENY
ncbi:uncharacterized protein [Periplaneta americana]|uniref:uncharacterized protein isoform X3 n=1 Tax=Periplaneta americana TaxID=6978 RepID=UPI0037E88DFE